MDEISSTWCHSGSTSLLDAYLKFELVAFSTNNYDQCSMKDYQFQIYIFVTLFGFPFGDNFANLMFAQDRDYLSLTMPIYVSANDSRHCILGSQNMEK